MRLFPTARGFFSSSRDARNPSAFAVVKYRAATTRTHSFRSRLPRRIFSRNWSDNWLKSTVFLPKIRATPAGDIYRATCSFYYITTTSSENVRLSIMQGGRRARSRDFARAAVTLLSREFLLAKGAISSR